MNTSQLPSVELIQGSPSPGPVDQGRGRRWKVFFAVLLLAAAIGVTIVYSRSPIYRASASVLTVKPKAVDRRSEEADIEHVAIQGRLLLGEELLGRVSQRLAEEGDDGIAGVDRLRGILTVVPVPETNLLELRAEGEFPEQLQRAVNRWAESYEVFRLEEIEAATGRTTAELEDQQEQLLAKIEKARTELLEFRETHDIVSLERDENRSLSALKGLNDSLNKARANLVEADARLIAVNEAIAKGETVIPSEQKADIARMKLDLERTSARVADLKQQYTQRYIDRDPVLKSLPAMLDEMKRELAGALKLAEQTVKDEAQQTVDAAQVSVRTLERELVQQQGKVQQFTQRFKEFKSLEEALASLERISVENQERLAQIQVQNLKKYPPIQVVEWARVPSRPIYPDYERDLMIALAAALGLALFVTWLVEYLSERPAPAQAMPNLGIRIYPGDQTQTLAAPVADNRLDYQQRATGSPAHPASPPPNLPILPRELAGAEIKSLIAVADPLTAGYATLLLSGVSPYELPLLHSGCFDRDGDRISVAGANRREFSIGAGAWRQLDPVLAELDDARMPLPLNELDTRLANAAHEAQLADPGSINALALWHTYVLFLVRQGIDVSVLTRRVGTIPPEVHGTMLHFAPPGGNRPLDSIAFIHPVLAS